MIHLDSHVLAWLYAGETDRFSVKALRLLEREELMVSPMAVLELQYLFEVKRINQPGQLVFDDLARRVGLRLDDRPLVEVVSASLQLSWTRDPFDRMICAQSLSEGAALLTADRTIHEHLELAVW